MKIVGHILRSRGDGTPGGGRPLRYAIALWVLAVCLLPSVASRGQDIHFSQLDANPVLVNPAYTGFYEGKGRIGLIYRNQWATVSTPFQTFAVTGEASLARSRTRPQGVSMGVFAYNDVAGTLHYGTLSGALSLAAYTALNRHGTSILSIGLEGGYGQMAFDPSKADMEDRSETFDQRKVQYPLAGVGIAWYYQLNGDVQTKMGVAAHNLNRPNISYMQLDDTHLEPRYNLYARAECRWWPSLSLMPALLAQVQGRYREVIGGADVKWYIEESATRQLSIGGGLAWRVGDALLADFQMEYDAFLFTLCYDTNISRLANASKTIGAFELGLVYRVARAARSKAIKCPVF